MGGRVFSPPFPLPVPQNTRTRPTGTHQSSYTFSSSLARNTVTSFCAFPRPSLATLLGILLLVLGANGQKKKDGGHGSGRPEAVGVAPASKRSHLVAPALCARSKSVRKPMRRCATLTAVWCKCATAQVESAVALNEQLVRENEVFLSFLQRHMPVGAALSHCAFLLKAPMRRSALGCLETAVGRVGCGHGVHLSPVARGWLSLACASM